MWGRSALKQSLRSGLRSDGKLDQLGIGESGDIRDVNATVYDCIMEYNIVS